MSPTLLLAMVIVQILAFQFAALRLSRSIPGTILGAQGLPDEAIHRIESYQSGLGRIRRALGGLFLLLAVVAALLAPMDRGHRKLGLAIVSVASSITLLLGYMRDARAVRVVAAEIPEPDLRAATLRRRSVRLYYPPILELVPVVFFFAIVAFTLLAARGVGAFTLWCFPIIQGIYVITAFLIAVLRPGGRQCMMQRAVVSQGSPEEGVALHEKLRRLQAQHGLATRIGVSFLLAWIQLERILRFRAGHTHPWLFAIEAIQAALVILLLADFVLYIVKVTNLRKSVARMGLCLLWIGACFGLPAAGAAIPAVSLAGIEDAGTFRFYLNEEVLVTQHFTWKPDGSYEGDYAVAVAGQTVDVSLKITPDAQGTWQSITLATPRGPVSIAREDTVARVTHEKDVSTVRLKPGTILFENFNPALMRLAVRAYDPAKGGKQTIPLFIVPSVVMDATLERQESLERVVQGNDLRLDRYLFGLPGVDVTLLLDDEGRIVFGDVPSQHGAYVREGYEALLKPEAADPLLSHPQYEVLVESNIKVPMRDGTRLATDLYRPKVEGAERFPVILVRTPYKKELNELQARFFARRGYAYAVQDCRGRFSSPGKWEPFVNEARDGYDSVEWLAVQPWASGKVGMIGASYLGWVQWWAARDRPPHLTTIIPNVSPPDPYFNIPYEYGCFFLLGAIWWADVLESEATADISGKAFAAISDKKYARLLRSLPVVDLDKKVLGKKNPYWRKWIEHPDNDAYWEPANFLDHLGPLDIPVFHQSGWFDGDGIGSKLNYGRMASYGHGFQKLVLGPWGHTDTATRRVGDRDFGAAAIVDLQREYLRWLDHWLKGVENGIDKEPLVSIFAMGSNRWLRGETYPLQETRMTKLYLSSEGHANTSTGDGRLAFAPPGGASPPDRFTYDPADPTPDPRMYVGPEDLEEEKSGEGDEARVVSVEEKRMKRKEYHGKVDAEREDILVYETEPLESPLTFAGPISAVLYAATSARDTDWFVRLSEVDSTGTVLSLTEGKIRARYAGSYAKPKLVTPGEVIAYGLDLWQTGITLAKGGKLRVEVASASFPTFSRNLNTGGHNETEKEFLKADQTIYHDAQHPSHILLPVIPDSL